MTKDFLINRIVIVSSVAHEYGSLNFDDLQMKKSWSAARSYANSKLANLYHGNELAKRLQGTGISVYSLHPGPVQTDIGRKYDSCFYECVKKFISVGMISPVEGAQTTLFCCLEDSIEAHSGRYYSKCREKSTKSKTKREEEWRRLWEVSEALVGLNE